MHVRTGLLVAAAAALVGSACTSSGGGAKSDGTWFQARPLIMPGQHATVVRADPFGSLRVPTTESGYYQRGRRQQAQLATALRGVDCAHPPSLAGSADRVVCDSDSDVLLLGPPIFTGNDVTQAEPLAPSETVAGWQLSLTLTESAANKMYRWTSRFHTMKQTGVFTDVQTSAKPPCSLATMTQCSDFTAYLSNSTVVSVPVTFSAVRTVVINGSFNEKLATQLAHKIAK
jgi:hypothetical protein